MRMIPSILSKPSETPETRGTKAQVWLAAGAGQCTRTATTGRVPFVIHGREDTRGAAGRPVIEAYRLLLAHNEQHPRKAPRGPSATGGSSHKEQAAHRPKLTVGKVGQEAATAAGLIEIIAGVDQSQRLIRVTTISPQRLNLFLMIVWQPSYPPPCQPPCPLTGRP